MLEFAARTSLARQKSLYDDDKPDKPNRVTITGWGVELSKMGGAFINSQHGLKKKYLRVVVLFSAGIS